MAKAVLRFQKLKNANLSGSSAHVSRSRKTPNADPDRKSLNKTIGNPDAKQAIMKRVDQVTEGRYRKDAVLAYEIVMTSSAEWFKDKSKKQVNDWANDSLSWVRETFGKENMVSATLHLDEAAPHIHAYVVPESHGRLCAKDYTGTRKQCSDLQTGYAKAVRKFGLDRGLKGSKAVHIPPQRFHSLINSQNLPDLPGRLASQNQRDEYQEILRILLGKQEAEIERLQKANELLARLTQIIGENDPKTIRKAVTGLQEAERTAIESTARAEAAEASQKASEDSVSELRGIMKAFGIQKPYELEMDLERLDRLRKEYGARHESRPSDLKPR